MPKPKQASMVDVFNPPVALIAKIGSILVHVDEGAGEGWARLRLGGRSVAHRGSRNPAMDRGLEGSRLGAGEAAVNYFGMPVVIAPVPGKLIGYEIVPIYPHPFWFWLRVLFRRPPPGPCLFRAGCRIEEPEILQMGNRLFMTAATWDALQTAIRQETINAARWSPEPGFKPATS